MPQKAYRFPAEVQLGGKVEVTLSLPPGSRVEVVALTQEDEFQNLVEEGHDLVAQILHLGKGPPTDCLPHDNPKHNLYLV